VEACGDPHQDSPSTSIKNKRKPGITKHDSLETQEQTCVNMNCMEKGSGGMKIVHMKATTML